MVGMTAAVLQHGQTRKAIKAKPEGGLDPPTMRGRHCAELPHQGTSQPSPWLHRASSRCSQKAIRCVPTPDVRPFTHSTGLASILDIDWYFQHTGDGILVLELLWALFTSPELPMYFCKQNWPQCVGGFPPGFSILQNFAGRRRFASLPVFQRKIHAVNADFQPRQLHQLNTRRAFRYT